LHTAEPSWATVHASWGQCFARVNFLRRNFLYPVHSLGEKTASGDKERSEKERSESQEARRLRRLTVAHSSATVHTMTLKTHTWLVTVDITAQHKTGFLSITAQLGDAGFECEFIRHRRRTAQYWVHHHCRAAMTKFVLQCPNDVRPFEYEGKQ
jgi:hypothetical protein